MNVEILVGVLLTPTLFLIGGFLWKRYPPKKINCLYGYRTRRSMANQKIWDYANNIGASMFLKLGWVLLAIGLLSYFTYADYAMIISIFSTLIGIGVGMFWCETTLNKRFDRNGNPK